MERVHEMHFSEAIKRFLDIIAALIVGGVIMKVLTAIATVLTIGWYCIRFYEYFKGNKEPK